jgi:prepilin-type N-terminal cleavage/methylation domain-containing protein
MSRGFTLIEVLIAITLSALILSSLITVYLSSTSQYHLQHQESRAQSKLDFTLSLLTRELESAGHIGCAVFTETFPLHNTTPFAFHPGVEVKAHELKLSYQSLTTFALVQAMSNLSWMKLPPKVNFKLQDLVLISDCASAELFEIEGIRLEAQALWVHSHHPLHKRYSIQAQLGQAVTHTYRLESHATKLNLYRIDRDNHKQAILEDLDLLNFKMNAQGQERFPENFASNIPIEGLEIEVGINQPFPQKAYAFVNLNHAR